MSVKICKEYLTVSSENSTENQDLKKVFESYPYELSDFQKHSIEATFYEKSSLITAGTGSGKTLPAEYAIKRNHEKGLKTIYTSPIKALSNQKYNEFTEKYPDISFGLITGDIKCNPNADCLIMTCEILRNHLFNMKYINENSATYFEMDFEKELGCVIFDEIHYINDRERGTVWEESIMGLPKNVYLVMLSATMRNPEMFANWVSEVTQKEVYLSGSTKRVVPLKHYSFLVFSEQNQTDIERSIHTESDKQIKSLVSQKNKKLILLKEAEGDFNEKEYYSLKKILDYVQKNRKNQKNSVRVNRTYVLNETVKYLKNHNMLPAIFFSLSRKNCEYFASLIQENLHEEDSKKPSTAEQDCKQILMKLPNYKEYLENSEFTTLVSLLQKGIAYHHSGLLSVYREMVEIMFTKGYVKLLFATETFSVGINLPTKTVVFDSFQKFDGSQRRILKSHEYTQMSGRAGRRGLDTVGYVLHLNGLSDLPTVTEYREMLINRPVGFRSKFKLDFNLILRLIKVLKEPNLLNFETFVKTSFYRNEIQNDINTAENELTKATKDLNDSGFSTRVPNKVFEEYSDLKKQFDTTKQKKKQTQFRRKIEQIEDFNRTLKEDFQLFLRNQSLIENKQKASANLEQVKNHIPSYINRILSILKEHGFIDQDNKLLENGVNASYLQEAHSLAFVSVLKDLENYDESQIVAILSCVTEVSIPDDDRMQISQAPESLREILQKISDEYNKFNDIEARSQIDSSYRYSLQFDTCKLMLDWCSADNEQDCKRIIQEANQSGIYLGSFIKSVLKINNLVSELSCCNISLELQNKLSKISEKTLIYVVTNQSLYV
jgi:superfamily II RNA helicase